MKSQTTEALYDQSYLVARVYVRCVLDLLRLMKNGFSMPVPPLTYQPQLNLPDASISANVKRNFVLSACRHLDLDVSADKIAKCSEDHINQKNWVSANLQALIEEYHRLIAEDYATH